MNAEGYLEEAVEALQDVKGRRYDVLDVRRPESLDEAAELGQVINKITPIVANTIEFRVAEHLNDTMDLPPGVHWERQDPEFPDVVLKGLGGSQPGVEIKAWYPLSTEMTGRFRETQRHLMDDLTKIAVLAWVPEGIIYGQPKIIDVFVDDALNVAQSRDSKYHDPPDYLVLEPFDTSDRTSNLQQSNVWGHRLQENDPDRINEARELATELNLLNTEYESSYDYHKRLQRLYSEFDYRQETNFAKLARLKHAPLDAFDDKVMNTSYKGRTITQWRSAIKSEKENALEELLYDEVKQENLDGY